MGDDVITCKDCLERLPKVETAASAMTKIAASALRESERLRGNNSYLGIRTVEGVLVTVKTSQIVEVLERLV